LNYEVRVRKGIIDPNIFCVFNQPTTDQQQQLVRLSDCQIVETINQRNQQPYPPWDFLERKNKAVEMLKEFSQVAIDSQTMLDKLSWPPWDFLELFWRTQ